MIDIIKEFLELANTLMKSKIVNLINLVSVAIKAISGNIQKELERIKRQLKNMAIIFLMIFFALIALVIGIGSYIEHKFAALANGKGFMIISLILVIIAIIYGLATKEKKN